MASLGELYRRYDPLEAASSVVVAGLLLSSGFATWKGMNEFILANLSADPALRGRFPPETAAMVPLYVFMAVAILTIAMWTAIEYALSRHSPLKRLAGLAMYLLLMLWSVCFGFGFWYEAIASHADTTAQLEAAQGQVLKAANQVRFKVNNVKLELSKLREDSMALATKEKEFGGTCLGATAKRTCGSYCLYREVQTTTLLQILQRIDQNWLTPTDEQINIIQDTMTSFRDAAAKGDGDAAARRQAFEAAKRKFDMAAIAIRTSSEAQRHIAPPALEAVSAAFLKQSNDKTGQCYDPGLAGQIKTAAALIGEPIKMPDVSIAFTEDHAAAFAVQDLWTTTMAAVAAAPQWIAGGEIPHPEILRTAEAKVALIAAIIIDISIAVFSWLRRQQPLRQLSQIASALASFLTDHAEDARRLLDEYVTRTGAAAYLIVPPRAMAASAAQRSDVLALENIALLLFHAGNRHFRAVLPTSNRAMALAVARLRGSGWVLAEDSGSSGVSLVRLSNQEALALKLFARRRPAGRRDLFTRATPRREARKMVAEQTIAVDDKAPSSSGDGELGSLIDHAFARHRPGIGAAATTAPAAVASRRETATQRVQEMAQRQTPDHGHQIGYDRANLPIAESSSQQPAVGGRNGAGPAIEDVADEKTPLIDLAAGSRAEPSAARRDPGNPRSRFENTPIKHALDKPSGGNASARFEQLLDAAERGGLSAERRDAIAGLVEDERDPRSVYEAWQAALNNARRDPDHVRGLTDSACLEEGLDRLEQMVRASGIEPTARVGQVFDPKPPLSHYASEERPSELPKGRIVEVLRQGWRRGERPVTEALVVVSSGAVPKAMTPEPVSGRLNARTTTTPL